MQGEPFRHRQGEKLSGFAKNVAAKHSNRWAGVGIGSVFVALLSHAITVPSFAPYIALMIGLGVGIDYALFIVVRYRSGLHDGLSPEDADVLSLTTVMSVA